MGHHTRCAVRIHKAEADTAQTLDLRPFNFVSGACNGSGTSPAQLPPSLWDTATPRNRPPSHRQLHRDTNPRRLFRADKSINSTARELSHTECLKEDTSSRDEGTQHRPRMRSLTTEPGTHSRLARTTEVWAAPQPQFRNHAYANVCKLSKTGKGKKLPGTSQSTRADLRIGEIGTSEAGT